MKFGNEFWLILIQEYIIPNLFAVYKEKFQMVGEVVLDPSNRILPFEHSVFKLKKKHICLRSVQQN